MAQAGVSLSKGCSLWGKHLFSQSIIPQLPLDRSKMWLLFSPWYLEPIMKNGFKSILRRKKRTLCKGLNFWTPRRGFENGVKAKRWEGWGFSSRFLCCLSCSRDNYPPKLDCRSFSDYPWSGTEEWESCEHLQWVQQWVLTAERSWCLESSPRFSWAPSCSTDLK